MDVDVHAGRAASVDPPPDRDAATRVGALQRSVVVRVRLHRVDYLDETDGREDGAVDTPRSLFRCVHQPKFERVDADLLGQFVDHRLGGELGIGRAGRAVGVRGRLVDEDAETLDVAVFEVVGSEHAHAARPDHRAGVRAGLVGEHRLGGSEFALLRRAHLDHDVRSGRRAGSLEVLGARHDDLHGAVGLPREVCGQWRSVRLELAAKASADLLRRQNDLRLGDAEGVGRAVADFHRPLCAAPDVDSPVLLPVHRRVLRLDVPLVHGRRVEGALDDEVGLGEPLIHVALDVVDVLLDVRRYVVVLAMVLGAVLLVQYRSAVGKRLGGGHHGWQQLILNLDERQSLLGVVDGARGDPRDGMALVEHLLAGHERLAQVLVLPVLRGSRRRSSRP